MAGSGKQNDDRLTLFLEHWKDVCGTGNTPEFWVCPGVVATRRGYGITAANVACLHDLRSSGHEKALVFEDDVRLTDASLCARQAARTMGTAPPDALLLLLGGHHFDLPAGAGRLYAV